MAVSETPDYQEKYYDYKFKGKRDNEHIILVLRRHWITVVFDFVPIFFFFLGLIFIHFFVFQTGAIFHFDINSNLLGLIETFLLLFFWLAAFIIWIDYYLDVWIITDQRIVNIEQFGLFQREISELGHERVQDVTTEVRGLIPTLLQYGYVYIQTAGEVERFIFKQVPNPTEVRKIIMQLQKYVILEEKREEGAILRGKL